MKIQIIDVKIETKPTAKGSYQIAEVAYKGEDGKVAGKKIMSFGAGEAAFKVLADNAAGKTFDVTSVKNDKGYWDWTSLTLSDGHSNKIPAETTKASTPVGRSNYETPEERAQRQVLIVRQSSLSASIASYGTKLPTDVKDVTARAQYFTDWVFQTNQAQLTHSALDDIPQDVPF